MDFTNIPYQRVPLELISHPKISNIQFRVLCNLLQYSIRDNHSYLGSFKLAEACTIGRAALIRTLKELEAMDFVKISQRGTFSRSNDIELTMERGLARLRSGETSNEHPQVYLNDTPEVSQNDSPTVYLNDTQVYQNDSRVYLNDTPHIDLKFKNLDLKYNNTEVSQNDTPVGGKDGAGNGSVLESVHESVAEDNQIAPADGAAGRSMPIQESAKEVRVEAQTELEDFCLVAAFYEAFPELVAWLNFARVGGYIVIQPIGKIGQNKLDAVSSAVSGWFAMRGVKLQLCPANKHLKGTIIKEVA